MVTVIRASSIFLFATLLFTIATFQALPLAALAQSEESDDSTVTASSSAPEATTTLAVVAEPVQADWLKIEKLFGGNLQQGDFVLSPGRVELEVRPGETVVHEISVSNRIDDDRLFKLSTEDITGSSQGDQSVVLLGDDTGPYSIKDIISLPADSFTIKLGERGIIPITISIPEDAEPGGYYGAVLVSTVRIQDASSNGQQAVVRSPIVARIGTLFFITVPGSVETEGALKDFSIINAALWHEKGPINFGITFENTGSKHLNPYGEIRVTNMLGEEVGFEEIDPWFVLPRAIRTREISWNRELLFGRYTATVHINRGYDDMVDSMSVSFWVLPWKIVATVFGVVFVISFLIRLFFRTFEFKRKGE